MTRALLLSTALLVAVLMGCSSSSGPTNDPANSFRVNGDGYSNALVEVLTTQQDGYTAVESEGMGSVGLVGTLGEDVFTATLTISNVKTGTFAVNAFDGVTLSLGVVKPASGLSFYFAESGTITVDTWGGVGGKAKGSFEAVVKKSSGSGTITVKGSFDIPSIAGD